MSNTMTPERLSALVSELLESAAFVFAENADGVPWSDEEIWRARLQVEQRKKIELSLCVSRTLGLTLAANLLGLEPDSADATEGLRDAVGEMANMLAGVLSVELFGSDVVCRIGVPEVNQETSGEHDAHSALAVCRVAMQTEEGQRLDVSLVEIAFQAEGSEKTPTGGDS